MAWRYRDDELPLWFRLSKRHVFQSTRQDGWGELIDEDAIDVKRHLVVSVASNPIRIFRLFSGGHKPIATLRLDTNYSEPDIERMQWQIDRLVVWYRDDAGKLRRASVAIPH